MIVHNIADCYSYLGNYSLAIEFYIDALKLFKIVKNIKGIADCQIDMSYLFSENKQYNKALDYLFEALLTYTKNKNKKNQSLVLTQIGVNYSKLNKIDTALNYYKQSLEIAILNSDGMGISRNKYQIAKLLRKDKKYSEALENFNTALSIRNKLNDVLSVGEIYYQIGYTYLEKNDYKRALTYTQNALQIFIEFSSLENLHSAYNNISKCYVAMNEYKKAYKYQLLYKQFYDSLFSENNKKQLLEVETKYQTEMKQQKIEMQNMQIAKKNKEINSGKFRQKMLISGIIIISLVVLIILFSYRKIVKQKSKINQQHQIVIHQKEQITDSIFYAKRIQNALLPSENQMQTLLNEFFVLYYPKDIVSGDFYWIKQSGNKIIVAIADCTGHGVPGAFMSMLGISFLNEIGTKNIENSNEILEFLRKQVKTTLKQSENDTKDGMDIALILIDNEIGKIQYSGAYNPLYIIRNNKLIEIKADRQPVGTHIREKQFTKHEISIQKNDMIYMFSDGYADQIGGDRNKKYMTINLKNLLLRINNETIQKQKEILSTEFDNWKKDNEQVDDVLIAGIRIN